MSLARLLPLLLLLVACGHDPPEPRALAAPPPSQQPAPTATGTPAPSQTPVPTPNPTPSATVSPGEDVTARIVVKRCLRYLPLVDRWNPDFDLDPALVLAVMAQESHCLQGATDETGAANSLGLMQVIPSTWTTTEERLNVASVNVYWGMRILWLTINDDLHNPEHGVSRALMAYNCGWREDDCGTRYANRVLTFWRPYVVEAMKGGG